MTRIAVGGFLHETNTFAPTKATYDDFVHGGGWPPMSQGAKLLENMRNINVGMAGFVPAAEAEGWELVPTIWCAASPSAHVTKDAYERVAKTMVDGIAAAGQLDAVYLDLHGAMVTEHLDDGEGEILARVRKVIGKNLPLVVSLDLHANVTPQMVEHADALIAYRTYPHVDMADTGRAAAKHLALLLRSKQRFARAFRQLPFLIPISWQCTNDQPTKGIYQKLAALQGEPVPTLSFAPGFPAADFPDCGATVFAYGKTQADANAAADNIAALIESHEGDFEGRIYTPDEGVRHAMELAKHASKPVVIADTQDNPGAGGDSDTTGMLRALVRNGATKAAIGVIVDPAICESRARGGTRRDHQTRARRQIGHIRRRAVRGNICRRATLRRPVHRARSILRGQQNESRRLGLPAHRRRSCGGRITQGAARRSGDVSLRRHRTDGAIDPRQQELGAFSRRFRTDRRKADHLRRARRDARRHRGIAMDAVASGYSYQAERSRVRAPSQIAFTLSRHRINQMPNIDRIEAFADELTAIRRDLHAHPEIGFEEIRTSGIVADKLTQWGIEVHRGLGGTGVVGVLKGKGSGGKRIGLRADMDALPMEENTNLRWRSTIPGRFHGCGHDGHTTMLLGTARYLAETRNFDGTVHFIFQPAEEGLGGARAMIKDGLFEKFPCDEVYGLHNAPDLNHGEVAILPGPAMAGADFFDITISGYGAHGAMPERSKDAVVIAMTLGQALQTIVSRNVDPLQSAVLSITQIHAGSAYNVIPGEAKLCGTVRGFSDEVRALIRERMRAICAGIASAFQVEISADIRDTFSVLVNQEEQSRVIAEVARTVVDPAKVFTRSQPKMGSEDFADMLHAVPGAYFWLGHEGSVPVHNPGYVLDDKILPIGASMFARIIETRLPAGAHA